MRDNRGCREVTAEDVGSKEQEKLEPGLLPSASVG